MKLERITEYVMPVIVSGLGVALAVYLGQASGTGQTAVFALLPAAVVAFMLAHALQLRVWLLLPLCWGMMGQISVLPLPFTVRELAVLYVFGCFMVFKAVKIIRNKPQYNALDIVYFINLAWVIICYIRHPTGSYGTTSERIGGKPYLEILIGFLAFWVLARCPLSPKDAVRLPILFLMGYSVESILGIITNTFPFTAPILGKLYSGIAPGAYNMEMSGAVQSEDGVGRLCFLAPCGGQLMVTLCACYRPLTLFNPLFLKRFLCFVLAFYFIFQSGFRSMFAKAVFMIVLGTVFRRKMADFWKITAICLLSIVFLVLMQGSFFTLPLNAQRALSFLPGKWDERAVKDAKGSSEWREEMVKAIWKDKRYLENKWLGDGFGFTMVQFKAMQMVGYFDNEPYGDRTNFMITGAIHNGPVSTIRYVGYIGLALYITLLVWILTYAVTIIRRARGTPYFAMALVIGMPAVIDPFTFCFIFGSYDAGLTDAGFIVGMLKIMGRALDNYKPPQAVETDSRSAFEPQFLGGGPRPTL